jgi:uncharacterized membrane protein YgdD (TMEM256/DUF423 family)
VFNAFRLRWLHVERADRIVAWQHSITSTAALHSLALLLLLVISDDGCFFIYFFFFFFVRCLASGSLYAAKVNAPVGL